ncbi:MAG: hypothetical protein M1286_02745 [Candidatus Marsarchaeota archaeon]|nr:hypothetical protein [Candidatus Marsarchaeota archaeon]
METYDVVSVRQKGIWGSSLLIIFIVVSLLLSFVYYAAVASNPTLYQDYFLVFGTIEIGGLLLLTSALYDFGKANNKQRIGTLAVVGTILYIVGTAQGWISTFAYGSMPAWLQFVIIGLAGLISHGAYLIALVDIGNVSKIELFKYSGYALFVSAILAFVITIFADPIGLVAWILCAIGFNNLKK